MISENSKCSALKIPRRATSNIPSENSNPKNIPSPVIPKITQPENNFEENMELRDFKPSALKLTIRSADVKIKIKIISNKYIFSIYFSESDNPAKVFLIPLQNTFKNIK